MIVCYISVYNRNEAWNVQTYIHTYKAAVSRSWKDTDCCGKLCFGSMERIPKMHARCFDVSTRSSAWNWNRWHWTRLTNKARPSKRRDKKEFMPIITVTSAPRSSLSWWCCWVNRLGGKAVYTPIQVCRVCMWPSVVVKFKVEPTLCVSPCLWQHKNNDASDKIFRPTLVLVYTLIGTCLSQLDHHAYKNLSCSLLVPPFF